MRWLYVEIRSDHKPSHMWYEQELFDGAMKMVRDRCSIFIETDRLIGWTISNRELPRFFIHEDLLEGVLR